MLQLPSLPLRKRNLLYPSLLLTDLSGTADPVLSSLLRSVELISCLGNPLASSIKAALHMGLLCIATLHSPGIRYHPFQAMPGVGPRFSASVNQCNSDFKGPRFKPAWCYLYKVKLVLQSVYLAFPARPCFLLISLHNFYVHSYSFPSLWVAVCPRLLYGGWIK